jgi:Xaa-Pro dipeptidase
MSAAQRQAACLEAMKARSLDVMVGFTSGLHNFLIGEPVLSLTGFRPIGDCAVVLESSGAATLIVSPAWDAGRARELSPDLKVVASDDLVTSLGDRLGTLNVARSRLGVAGLGLMSQDVAARAGKLLDEDTQAVDGIVRSIGRIKTAEDLANARRATEIAEQGYQRLLDTVRPGMYEFELAAELYCYMKALGSEDNFLMMSSSQHNLAVRAPSRRILAEGDIVLVEITPCVEGQFSQICRTAKIGPASDQLMEKFELLREATQVGLKAAVPGSTMADACSAMDDVFRRAGYGDYCRPPYMRVRGHGLGMVSDLPGDVATDNKTVLESDMVYIIHPNQYIPETGYLMCGEPVRIAAGGAEALTRAPGRLDIISV